MASLCPINDRSFVGAYCSGRFTFYLGFLWQILFETLKHLETEIFIHWWFTTEEKFECKVHKLE